MLTGFGGVAPMNLSGTVAPKQVEEDSYSSVEREEKRSDEFDSVMEERMDKGRSDGYDADPASYEVPGHEKPGHRADPNWDALSVEDQKRLDAMLKFMDSLEGELGVKPEEMLQAMRAVSMEGGEHTPEQAVAKALVKLRVDPEQVDRAAELYADFLVGAEYGASALAAKHAVPVSDMNFQVLTKEQQRQNELRSSVESMRSTFFGTGDDMASSSMMSEAGTEIRRNPIQVPDLMNLNPDAAKSADAEMANVVADGDELINQGQHSLSQSDSMDAMLDLMEKPTSEMSTDDMLSQMGMEDVEMPKMPSDSLDLASMGDDSSQMLEGLDAGGSDGSFDSEFLGDNFSSGEEALTEGADEFVMPAVATKATHKVAASQSQPLAADTEAQAQNVEDLVNQAQVLVRKGGGQMKVRLNPEGLGQVDLKVDVNQGNVNIQMVADHSEAKRALEKGINELKTNLALHKMNVENIKVDISSELSKNLMEFEQQQDLARETARDFMGKMQDQRNSSQGEFLQSPFQQYYGQQREEVEPLALASTADNQKTENRRLHLVA